MALYFQLKITKTARNKNAYFFTDISCFYKQYNYLEIFVVPQLFRRYDTITKVVAAKRSSHQKELPLKAVLVFRIMKLVST